MIWYMTVWVCNADKCRVCKTGELYIEASIAGICGDTFNTMRTGLLNCLNARSRGLNFRHRASCI